MPQGSWGIAALAVTLAAAAPAQEATDCRGLSPEAAQDAYRAFDCISRLDAALAAAESRIATLEARLDSLAARIALSEPGTLLDPVNERLNGLSLRLYMLDPVPSTGQHPGSRAVVAYTSDLSGPSCPQGWSIYEPGLPGAIAEDAGQPRPDTLYFCRKD